MLEDTVMKTITWNKHLGNGKTEIVNFTRLFSEQGSKDSATVKEALHILAKRQGLIRSEAQFQEIMERLSREHEIAVRNARCPKEYALSIEYYGSQALIAAVRYALFSNDESTNSIVLRRFNMFTDELRARSTGRMSRRAS